MSPRRKPNRPGSTPGRPCKLVAYYRVSTDKQGESGLGLEAQRASVAAYAGSTGAEITREFTEVETSTKRDLSNRPELSEALRWCQRTGAILVIAKLDRLARNVAFLSGLMEAGTPFVACDNPHANRLTLHILAAVAEDEARRISERTRAALAAYKARGGKIGAELPNAHEFSREERAKGTRAMQKTWQDATRDVYGPVWPTILEMRAEGATLREIADRLNENGHTTFSGKPWNVMQVSRLLKRNGLR